MTAAGEGEGGDVGAGVGVGTPAAGAGAGVTAGDGETNGTGEAAATDGIGSAGKPACDPAGAGDWVQAATRRTAPTTPSNRGTRMAEEASTRPRKPFRLWPHQEDWRNENSALDTALGGGGVAEARRGAGTV